MADDPNIPGQAYGFDVDIKITSQNGTTTVPIHNIGEVTIIQSLALYCTVAKVKLALDPAVFQMHKFDGSEQYEMTIQKKVNDPTQGEVISYKFISLDGVCHLPIQANSEIKTDASTQTRVEFPLRLMDAQAAKVIHFTVGSVHKETTIETIVKKILKDGSSGSSLSTEVIPFQNTAICHQIILTKQSLASALRYLSKYYGFYETSPFFFIDPEYITICPSGKTGSLKRDKVTVIQVSDKKNYDAKPHQYLTSSKFKISHETNSTASSVGKQVKCIRFPLDSLYTVQDFDFNKLTKESGYTGKNSDIDWADKIISGVTYTTTWGPSEVHGRQHITDDLYKNVKAEVTIGYMTNLTVKDFRPLTEVELIADNMSYVDYVGKYFIYTTVLNFKKDGNAWIPTVDLSLVRSNIGI